MVLEIEFDDQNARRSLRELEAGVPNDKDEIAEELAKEGKRRMVRELKRQGSVSSGFGIRNIRVRRDGFGRYSIVGPKYLRYLDQGTKPHFPPYASNNRFQKWAFTHGMSPKALAETIAIKGTKPHPFIARALLPIIRSADDKALDEMEETVDRA